MSLALCAFSEDDSVMYCPQCRTEYREGFAECNACLIPLIDGAAGRPLPNDSQWTRTTRLGSKGTRLIFLYLAQVLIIGIGIAVQWWQIGTSRLMVGSFSVLRLMGAFCGLASGISILTRQKFAPYLIYSFLGIYLIVSVFGILRTSLDLGIRGSLVGAVVGGIFLPFAWLVYFHRRRNLFG
jgi:hypothetical protein